MFGDQVWGFLSGRTDSEQTASLEWGQHTGSVSALPPLGRENKPAQVRLTKQVDPKTVMDVSIGPTTEIVLRRPADGVEVAVSPEIGYVRGSVERSSALGPLKATTRLDFTKTFRDTNVRQTTEIEHSMGVLGLVTGGSTKGGLEPWWVYGGRSNGSLHTSVAVAVDRDTYLQTNAGAAVRHGSGESSVTVSHDPYTSLPYNAAVQHVSGVGPYWFTIRGETAVGGPTRDHALETKARRDWDWGSFGLGLRMTAAGLVPNAGLKIH